MMNIAAHEQGLLQPENPALASQNLLPVDEFVEMDLNDAGKLLISLEAERNQYLALRDPALLGALAITEQLLAERRAQAIEGIIAPKEERERWQASEAGKEYKQLVESNNKAWEKWDEMHAIAFFDDQQRHLREAAPAVSDDAGLPGRKKKKKNNKVTLLAA